MLRRHVRPYICLNKDLSTLQHFVGGRDLPTASTAVCQLCFKQDFNTDLRTEDRNQILKKNLASFGIPSSFLIIMELVKLVFQERFGKPSGSQTFHEALLMQQLIAHIGPARKPLQSTSNKARVDRLWMF